MSPFRLLFPLGFLTLLCGACSDKAQTKDDDAYTIEAQRKSEEFVNEQGLIVYTFDDTGDGVAEITKYFEEIPDPDDATKRVRRMRKMELDLNEDGLVDVQRDYNLAGSMISEARDTDLDGKVDVKSYYDQGDMVKKETFKDGTDKVDAVRFYVEGELIRLERDTDGDGQPDYWEFYEEGVLTRIGRDYNADGRADSWQRRS